MGGGLNVIIVVDDPAVAEFVQSTVRRFYAWGDVVAFCDPDEAVAFCLSHDVGIAVFIVEVFLRDRSGFYFLDSIDTKFPTAHEDAIMVTGNATDDVVNMCVASYVNYLLEKPLKPYALQLAVRSIVAKYMNFPRRLAQHPELKKKIAQLEELFSQGI